jgi:hypothetical protein
MKTDIRPIDSKQTILSPDDVVLVAAYTTDPSEYEESAKEHGIDVERLIHTVYVQLMQDPNLLLIREGNTLFNIAALPDRHGYVSMYNGDTENNVASNFVQFLQAAYKMGFNILMVNCMDESLNNSADEIESLAQDAEFVYDEEDELLYVKFNEPHGD